MTDGHKGDLFYLHISFLGWLLLSAVTYNILGIVYVFPYFLPILATRRETIKNKTPRTKLAAYGITESISETSIEFPVLYL